MIMMIIMMLLCYCYCVIVVRRGLVSDDDHNDCDDDVIVLDQPFDFFFKLYLILTKKNLTQELKSRLGLTQILQSRALKPPHSRLEHHRKPPLPFCLFNSPSNLAAEPAWM